MVLFLKSILIGLAKIIPGVSGALLAINFGIYEKLIKSLTNFFDDYKTNLKFLLITLSGIGISIVLGSKLLLYLFTNYKFITLSFFIGLIIGGTYNFSKHLSFNKNNLLLITFTTIFFSILCLSNTNNIYLIKNNFTDNLIFFSAGIIEILSSLIPGISGTSLLMIIGAYEHILLIISNIFNYSYVINHINYYLSYGIGMFISFIIGIYLISYLLNNHRKITYTIIFGLSLSSIIYLINILINIPINLISIVIGIMFLTIGLLISIILK